MSWDLFVMDLPPDATSADAIPPGWIPPPLPARADIIRAILQVDPTADTSDPAWVRVNGPGFSVEINIGEKTPLSTFACHVRGGDLAVGFITTLLDRLQLRALDPGSASGLFDAATAPDSQARWRRYRDQVVAGQGLAGGDGLEFDSPETLVALSRRLVPAPKPAGSTNYDPAVIEATAAKLLAQFERLFVAAPETVWVDASLCEHAIQAWYDKVTRDLEVEGFQALGDFTSASAMAARKTQRVPGFSRKFVSVDGKIRATAIYMPAAKSGQPDTQIIGFNSEFNDGTFLRTSNSTEKWDTPDRLFAEKLPRETSPAALAGRHRARVASHLASNANATVVVMQSLQDVFDSENRSQLLTSAFRRRRGIPSIDELVRFGLARELAHRVHQEMQETKRREH